MLIEGLDPDLVQLITRLGDVHPDDLPPSIRELRRIWIRNGSKVFDVPREVAQAIEVVRGELEGWNCPQEPSCKRHLHTVGVTCSAASTLTRFVSSLK